MKQNYFLLDKNYILKEVQTSLEEKLVITMIEKVINTYLTRCNPLGLIDDTILAIRDYHTGYSQHFHEFYTLLCGIYRYQIGTNQLEFLFDGKSHQDKYFEDWSITFQQWTNEFCDCERFLKMVLSLTVFYEDEKSAILAEGRLKYFLSQHFQLKIYKYKGIMNMQVA